jgi:hypothetical protein
LEDWRNAGLGREAIVGAVDLSTHEFKRSDVWTKDREQKGAKVTAAICAQWPVF